MTTTINNNERIFHVQSFGIGAAVDIFCNLQHIPNVVQTQIDAHSQYNVFHFWGRKWKRCSKKLLNDMFKAHGIDFKVN